MVLKCACIQLNVYIIDTENFYHANHLIEHELR